MTGLQVGMTGTHRRFDRLEKSTDIFTVQLSEITKLEADRGNLPRASFRSMGGFDPDQESSEASIGTPSCIQRTRTGTKWNDVRIELD